MREQELRRLWGDILRMTRHDGEELPLSARAAIIDNRLPDLLKARCAVDPRLPEATKRAAIARLVASAQQR